MPLFLCLIVTVKSSYSLKGFLLNRHSPVLSIFILPLLDFKLWIDTSCWRGRNQTQQKQILKFLLVCFPCPVCVAHSVILICSSNSHPSMKILQETLPPILGRQGNRSSNKPPKHDTDIKHCKKHNITDPLYWDLHHHHTDHQNVWRRHFRWHLCVDPL